jgi:hypothetical protein
VRLVVETCRDYINHVKQRKRYSNLRISHIQANLQYQADMSRALLNFFLDVILLLITVTLIATTCVLFFVFPPATAAAGWVLWGLDYDGWARLHFGLLAVIAFAILVHVMLHWNWVCSIIATRLLRRSGNVDDGIQTLYGVSTLIVLVMVLSALIVAAQLSIRSPVPR